MNCLLSSEGEWLAFFFLKYHKFMNLNKFDGFQLITISLMNLKLSHLREPVKLAPDSFWYYLVVYDSFLILYEKMF